MQAMVAKPRNVRTKAAELVPREVPDITADLLQGLKQVVPGVFSDKKLDVEKLQGLLGQSAMAGPERFTFSWAGRQDAARMLQMPTRATLYAKKDKSVDIQTTRNLFIEGDNLEVLKLLYRPFFGQVKMIYIDPPYNTGSDFVYQDDYSDPLKTYLTLSGQADPEGSPHYGATLRRKVGSTAPGYR